ncbi:glutaredoxin 2 [Vibrio gallicus]|uniref:glutaredoxin 2 n=1 Tax=Vibrio gallicus TaxID=190897 RepID=UPI0021C3F3AD|nr:glutaredoxin 2 [Vibrio gallicus]
MKLYIYEHCPFCARVAFVAQTLGLDIEYVVVDYADADTLINLIGQKMVPVLEKDDGSIMAESLDMIAYFLDTANSSQARLPSAATLAFQQQAFPWIQRIGYPRWSNLDLKEFQSDSSKMAWRAKKETQALNFDHLLEQTKPIVEQVNSLLIDAQALIEPNSGVSTLPIVDQALYFSLLRGFFAEPSIEWPTELKQWLVTCSQSKRLRLVQ